MLSTRKPIICSTLLLTAAALGATATKPRLTVSNLRVSPPSLNPTKGERATIEVNLSAPARLSARVLGPDHQILRTIQTPDPVGPGNATLTWDGRDDEGAIVPNEAYYFLLVATGAGGQQAVLDPLRIAGGERFDIARGRWEPTKSKLHYFLPEAGRVLVRVGLHDGPLLRTLVNWEPRTKGAVVETWDGKDPSGQVNVGHIPNLKFVVTGFYLPAGSVITRGNGRMDYAAYRQARDRQGGRKRAHPPSSQPAPSYGRPLSSVFWQDRLLHRDLRLKLDLRTDAGQSPPRQIRRDQKLYARVSVDPRDGPILQRHPYEIVIYLDRKFVAEDENARVPFNWQLPTQAVSPGKHILTVNLHTVGGQVGTVTQLIQIVP